MVKGIVDITLSVLAYVFHMLTTENLFRAALNPLQCSQYLRMTFNPNSLSVDILLNAGKFISCYPYTFSLSKLFSVQEMSAQQAL